MHGAGGGAPTGPANRAWLHGDRSHATKQKMSYLTALLKLAQTGLEAFR